MPDGEHYVQRTETIKLKRDEGKVKRWVVNPVKRFVTEATKDTKKERVAA